MSCVCRVNKDLLFSLCARYPGSYQFTAEIWPPVLHPKLLSLQLPQETICHSNNLALQRSRACISCVHIVRAYCACISCVHIVRTYRAYISSVFQADLKPSSLIQTEESIMLVTLLYFHNYLVYACIYIYIYIYIYN